MKDKTINHLTLGPQKPYNPNIQKAIDFATKAHKGQFRKDGIPYIHHPLNVAQKVIEFKNSKSLTTLIISACLHDTLEDTNTTYDDIVKEFGLLVANIVKELTNDPKTKESLGKQQYLAQKMSEMSSWALVIKLCDRLDNVQDLVPCNQEFKTRYIRETIGILTNLIKNRTLSNTHKAIIEQIIHTLFWVCQNEDLKKEIDELHSLFTNHQKKYEKRFPY